MIKKLKNFKKKSEYDTEENIMKLDFIINEIKKRFLYNIKSNIKYEINKNNIIMKIVYNDKISNRDMKEMDFKNNINSYLGLFNFLNENENIYYLEGIIITIFLWTDEINNMYEKLNIMNKTKEYNL